MPANPYEQDLDRNPANYAPLTPLSFVERAAYVYPEATSVVHLAGFPASNFYIFDL